MDHFCCKQVINLVHLYMYCSHSRENHDVIVQHGSVLTSHIMVSMQADQ